MKFGLKLWSNNLTYFDEAASLYNDKVYDFIELYIVPSTYDATIAKWKTQKAPFVIHATHSHLHGVNLAIPEKEKENARLLRDTFRFADTLKADKIIFHGGTAGTEAETSRQMNQFNEKRALIENKPFLALDGKNICNGNSPEQISYIMEKTGAGFCLDIGHAISSANSHKIDAISYLKSFLELKPVMFHLSDGNYKSEMDSHGHFGSGDYPISKIMKLIPASGMITIESIKLSETKLDDFVKDVKFLRELS